MDLGSFNPTAHLLPELRLWVCRLAAGIGWDVQTTTFWTLGNMVAAQAQMASSADLAELRNHTNSVNGASPPMRALAFLCGIIVLTPPSKHPRVSNPPDISLTS
jgi:hypothetical protein